MLFLAENKRRKWCAANLGGNGFRVARHYDRTHPPTRHPPVGKGEARTRLRYGRVRAGAGLA